MYDIHHLALLLTSLTVAMSLPLTDWKQATDHLAQQQQLLTDDPTPLMSPSSSGCRNSLPRVAPSPRPLPRHIL